MIKTPLFEEAIYKDLGVFKLVKIEKVCSRLFVFKSTQK